MVSSQRLKFQSPSASRTAIRFRTIKYLENNVNIPVVPLQDT